MATIKGKWIFNENIIYPSTPTPSYDEQKYEFQNVNFTSNGNSYDSINISTSNGSRWNMLYYGYYDLAEMGGWIYGEEFRTVDFGNTDQTVSDTFYSWFTSNATQIVEHTVQIINPQMYILPPTKVVGNDLVVSAEEVVVNEAEEEGLYFYVDGTRFVLPEEGITFRTLLKNYGTDIGSDIAYYGEGAVGEYDNCLYSSEVNNSNTTLFYAESGAGSSIELNGTGITLNSTIVTGGEYTLVSSGSGGGSN